MTRWRILTLVALVVTPIVVLIGFGGYFLWERGWSFRAWFPLAGCLGLAYFLAWRWQRGRQLLPLDLTSPGHFTDRDRTAWALVETRAKQGETAPADRFSDPRFYFDHAEALALEVARHYHPNAPDPYGNLTVPELLAVAELAAADLARLVDKFVPGSHLMTVNNWKSARQLVDWYDHASNVWWFASALWNPIETATRFAAAKAGISSQLKQLQHNLIGWFFATFILELGKYLIELHSGRLKVGAKRYRELLGGAGPTAATPEAEVPAAPVTLVLCGQVKAGKSSLTNALLGEVKAVVDVLPATAAVSRYTVTSDDLGTSLTVLDTPGYGHAGPKEDGLKATEAAVRDADLVLLVLHARNPGRQADLALLERLKAFFAANPAYKPPPIVAVLTHADLLSPAVEWLPPYDWAGGARPKEKSMRDAVTTAREQLGAFLAGAVPVCLAPGKTFGVTEALLPEVARLLGDAKTVGMLRCLKREGDANQIRRLADQLLSAGKAAAVLVWQNLRK